MIEYSEDKKGLNSFILRLIGLALTTTWFIHQLQLSPSVRPWINYVNWIAFPIFAFLLAEGFSHTTDKRLYFRRLLLFSIISEFAYDYFVSGKFWYIEKQSVMLTFLIGYLVLLAINALRLKFHNTIISMAAIFVFGKIGQHAMNKLNCDFAQYGMIIILIFYVANLVSYTRITQFLAFFYLIMVSKTDYYIYFIIGNMQYTVPYKVLSLIALILIWFYNGKRGPNSQWLKPLFYLYYPVMVLIVAIFKNLGYRL